MEAALILIGSPRRAGNSARLAEAIKVGVERSGRHAEVRHLNDYIGHFLRDCKSCRNADGNCGIEDGFQSLFLHDYLSVSAIVFCSPIYWYGLSAVTKAFFDRMFCYYATSHPQSEDVIRQMTGKRLGLVLSSEETYPGAELGIVHQLQEFARYTRSDFIGSVRGIGNVRGEVAMDPAGPVRAAEKFGMTIFDRKYTDYRLDTVRSARVWPTAKTEADLR